MKTQYAGIDYGMGQTNIDTSNGIRYGVIPQNEVLQAWCDESTPYYGETEEGDDIDDFAEPISHYVDDGEYAAECGDSDIFVMKSPYYTHAQFCSPCVPGAGYITNHCEGGPKAYCFGHDWFDGGKAPYPVYKVGGKLAYRRRGGGWWRYGKERAILPPVTESRAYMYRKV